MHCAYSLITAVLITQAPIYLTQGATTVSPPVYDICNPAEPCVSGTYIAVPGQCTWYRLCNHGRWETRECQDDRCFNTDNDRCDHCFFDRCAPECTTGSPLPPVTRGPFDPCDLENTCFLPQQGQRVGDTENCTIFYQCEVGQHLVPQECAPGTCFDIITAACIECHLATCQPACPTTIDYIGESTTAFSSSETTIITERTSPVTEPGDLPEKDDHDSLGLIIGLSISIGINVILIAVIIVLVIKVRKLNSKIEPAKDEEEEDSPRVDADSSSKCNGFGHHQSTVSFEPPSVGEPNSKDASPGDPHYSSDQSTKAPGHENTNHTGTGPLGFLPPLGKKSTLTDFEMKERPDDMGPATVEDDMDMFKVDQGGDKEELVHKKKKKKKKKKNKDDESNLHDDSSELKNTL